ncbi:30S ribosomal protein S18 [Candidatus Falkowbacteria bacterium]|nr:30S ribosomal protein S18 [Candidatus Falkowbacteria bacterium]
MIRQNNSTATTGRKTCYFCANNVKEIDYKDEAVLRKFISSYGKIVPRRRSGVCTKHQRKLALAIKRARILGILPFTNK